MADLNEIVERLARLEQKADDQKEDIAEMKKSLKEVEKKVNRLSGMVYVLWVIGTAGMGLVVQLVGAKLKSAFGGHT